MSTGSRPPDLNLALELMRVTEAGALAAARAVGRDDVDLADRLAVEAVRLRLASLPIDGVVAVGEGEDRAHERIYLGERLGSGDEPRMDLAVDPIDGTSLVAAGQLGAICTVALSPRNAMFRTHVPYMERIVVGRAAVGAIDLRASIAENLNGVARAVGKPVSAVTVVMLERARHQGMIAEVRAAGAGVKLISDGDVAAAVLAALPEDNGVDMLLGIGGSPEATLTACAVLCLRGEMQARLWVQEADKAEADRQGIDRERIFTANDLCRGDDDVYMTMTGITDGELLRGVRRRTELAVTQSLVMRASAGTAQRIESTHDLTRLGESIGLSFEPLEP